MSKKERLKKKGRMAAAICHLFGIIILAVVIAALIPITVPRLMGYQVFNVISGSMEPEIPVNSIAYVDPVSPSEIADGEVIAFMSGGSVVMHRVVTNHSMEGFMTTKGDANPSEDIGEVQYDVVLGRVVKHFPYLGQLMWILSSTVGKMLMLCLAASGALLNILAGRIRDATAYA